MNSTPTGNDVLYAPEANTHGLFTEMHVYLQLCSIGQFGPNTAYLHLENYDVKEVFLSKP
jgi:hypothetical protein